MLTKDDLNKIQLLITDGLKPVIEDINGVKRDVSGLKKDVSGIKKDMGVVKKDISGVKREVDGLKDEIQEVKESITLLPTKEEFFDSTDKLMGEVKKSREEQEVVGDTLSQHNDRLEKLEEKVGIATPY